MVRHRLGTPSAFARHGYWLRATCDGCAHQAAIDPLAVMAKLHARGRGQSIDQLERRLHCRICGGRGATISAFQPPDRRAAPQDGARDPW